MTLLEIVLRNEVLEGVLKHRVDRVLLHFCLLFGVDIADMAGVHRLHQVGFDVGVGKEGVGGFVEVGHPVHHHGHHACVWVELDGQVHLGRLECLWQKEKNGL